MAIRFSNCCRFPNLSSESRVFYCPARLQMQASSMRACQKMVEQPLSLKAEVDPMLDSVKWDEKGLAVAIAQNVDTGAVLMQGFINRDALLTTISTRKATFYSRSRSTLWTKGETSKNFINVFDIFLDCDGDSESPWKSLEKAMGDLKNKPSIEDVLRDQIQKQEFYDDGGDTGGKPPRGGGGGGAGDGEAEGESFSEIVDEFMQVILATIGFIFLYVFILEGEDITALAKDFIKFLFTRKISIRLKRLINQWWDFLEDMKGEEEEPYWLERSILETRTSFDSPEKYDYIIRNRPDLLNDFFRSAAVANEPASHRDEED